jgi:hypothetical protein
MKEAANEAALLRFSKLFLNIAGQIQFDCRVAVGDLLPGVDYDLINNRELR